MLGKAVIKYHPLTVMEKYSDTELIAEMTGIKEEQAAKLDLNRIWDSANEVGISNAAVCRILAVQEFMRRELCRGQKKKGIRSPVDAYLFVKDRYSDECREAFGVVFLNTKNHVIDFKVMFTGGLCASIVDKRLVFEQAILSHAVAMILVHNHPSGDVEPSKEDCRLTNEMVRCGKFMEIPILDHLIIGNGRYLSMNQHGYVDFRLDG